MPITERGRIEDLLRSLFDDSEDLLMFVGRHSELADLRGHIPGRAAPFDEACSQLVVALDQHGLVTDDFFDALVAERPHRRAEIDAVRAATLDAPAPGPAPVPHTALATACHHFESSAPSLFERLKNEAESIIAQSVATDLLYTADLPRGVAKGYKLRWRPAAFDALAIESSLLDSVSVVMYHLILDDQSLSLHWNAWNLLGETRGSIWLSPTPEGARSLIHAEFEYRPDRFRAGKRDAFLRLIAPLAVEKFKEGTMVMYDHLLREFGGVPSPQE